MAHLAATEQLRLATTIGEMAVATSDLGSAEDQFFEIRDFRLENGTVMPRVTIAYETYGHSAAARPD